MAPSKPVNEVTLYPANKNGKKRTRDKMNASPQPEEVKKDEGDPAVSPPHKIQQHGSAMSRHAATVEDDDEDNVASKESERRVPGMVDGPPLARELAGSGTPQEDLPRATGMLGGCPQYHQLANSAPTQEGSRRNLARPTGVAQDAQAFNVASQMFRPMGQFHPQAAAAGFSAPQPGRGPANTGLHLPPHPPINPAPPPRQVRAQPAEGNEYSTIQGLRFQILDNVRVLGNYLIRPQYQPILMAGREAENTLQVHVVTLKQDGRWVAVWMAGWNHAILSSGAADSVVGALENLLELTSELLLGSLTGAGRLMYMGP